MNLKKSSLTPTQDLVYIRARFCTDLCRICRLYLLKDQVDRLLTLVRSFSRVGQYKSALLFQSLLDLMAATLPLVEYAHLCMHPI